MSLTERFDVFRELERRVAAERARVSALRGEIKALTAERDRFRDELVIVRKRADTLQAALNAMFERENQRFDLIVSPNTVNRGVT